MEYEEKLLNDLQKLSVNTWFRIDNRPDFDKIRETVKIFIDKGYNLILSSDYKKIKIESTEWQQPLYRLMKTLPEGVTVNHVTRGTMVEVIGHKGTTFNLQAPEHWVVSFNGKIIAIE